jgi:hypothetical protein
MSGENEVFEALSEQDLAEEIVAEIVAEEKDEAVQLSENISDDDDLPDVVPGQVSADNHGDVLGI